MKKKRYLVVILVLLIVLSTGCTKYLTDTNKKRIVNENTGQAVTSNILCLPEDEDLLKIYKDNEDRLDVDLSKLNSCTKYTPNDVTYKSLWDTIFIKPLAWLIIKIGILVNNYGLSVMILGLLIRLILMPFTKKSLSQSENMKKAQSEIQAIQKKYAGNSQAQTQMMQEMTMVYKKYNVNPAGGCIISVIQLPILLAFLEAINRVPAIFEGSFLSLQLGTSPLHGIKSGNYLYILVILFIIASTYFSFKISMGTNAGNSAQEKQTSMMMKFMIVFIAIASLSLPTALALYWIVSNAFMIAQNYFIKRNLNNNEQSGRVIEVKSPKKKGNKKNGTK